MKKGGGTGPMKPWQPANPIDLERKRCQIRSRPLRQEEISYK
jgi:hypothetical protein